MPVADPEHLGTLIRRFRLASGFSQEQLAERSGLSARAVSDLERGQRAHTRPETLRMLAEGLDLGEGDRTALLQAARPELRQSPRSSTGLPVGNGLPATPTRLIGRNREVVELVARLTQGDRKLTTLTGPGGVGKTRLALEVAHRAAPSFHDGAVFVDLAPVSDPNLVVSAIAQALSIHESGDRSIGDALRIALHDRSLLLLLDNFEQVIDSAPQVGELLVAAPDLRVLVTSREALHIRGEEELVIEPLQLPIESDTGALDQLMQSAAVELLVMIATFTNPGFELTEENAVPVAEICFRLDGLPLAIELAASRLKHFPPAVLLERLEHRLPVLTGGPRDIPARQQTLRDTIAWSYDLLTPDERTLFRRVGSFPGGATLAALDTYEKVAGPLELDLLSGLASLADKSLVRERIGADGAPRFSMLETIREFAGERVAQAGELETSHNVIVAWALEFVSSGKGGDFAWLLGGANLQQVSEEIDNVRLGFEIAAEKEDPESCALIFVGINGYFYLRGLFHEAESMGTKVLELAEKRALSDRLRGKSLRHLSGVWNTLYDAAEAEQMARDSLSLLQSASENEVDAIEALIVLVMTIRDQGRYAEALAHAEANDALASSPGGETHRPWTKFAVGKLSYLLGDQDRAVEYLREALRYSLAFGANEFAVHAANFLAAAHLRRGELLEAAVTLRQVIALWREAGSNGLGGFLDEAAILADATHYPEIAAKLFAADSAQMALFGMRVDNDPWTDEAKVDARTQLGDEAFESAIREGQALSLEAAVALVLDLINDIEQACADDNHVS